MFQTLSAMAISIISIGVAARHSHSRDNLMQVPEELRDPRRVVAAEQEDSSWHAIMALVCTVKEYHGSRSIVVT